MRTLLAALLCAQTAQAFLGPGVTICGSDSVKPCLTSHMTVKLTRNPPQVALKMTASPSTTKTGMTALYKQLSIPTQKGISVWDITPEIKEIVDESGIKEGFVNVISRHTTTGVTINECESRLVDDIRLYFQRLAPPTDHYLHNDIHLRPQGETDSKKVVANGWDISDPEQLQAWRDQEPFNAHSHLLSMMLGNSETIPVADGKMVIGQWQSVMMIDFDGPRTRTVGVQVFGA